MMFLKYLYVLLVFVLLSSCTKQQAAFTPLANNTDIKISSTVSSFIFSNNGDSIDIVYKLDELGGANAIPSKIRVFKPYGYSLSFSTLINSVTVNNTLYFVDNINWSQSLSTSLYNEYLKSGPIQANSTLYVLIRIIRNTPNQSTFNINSQFRPASGEVITSNNTNSILLISI